MGQPGSLELNEIYLVSTYMTSTKSIKILVQLQIVPVVEPQECHNKAWDLVGSYLESNLRMFSGKSVDADSTVLPSLASWVQDSLADIPEARSFEDHGVVLWVNLPTAGIIGASKYDFLLTSITNLLTQYKKNSIALIIHPNRAGQLQSSSRFGSILSCLLTLVTARVFAREYQ